MQIGTAVSADSLTFEHPLQSTSGKLRTALTKLNGAVLPITPSANEHLSTVRANIYYAAKQLGMEVATTLHDGVLYVHRKEQ